MAKLTYFSHSAWMIESGDFTILVDPFLDGNPTSPVKSEDVKADYIESGFYNMIKYILIGFLIGAAIRESIALLNKLRLKMIDQETQQKINLRGGLR